MKKFKKSSTKYKKPDVCFRMFLKCEARFAAKFVTLDGPTKHLLFKLVADGYIDQVLGSISVGKEANIMFARINAEEEVIIPIRHFAVKIYKSSMMTFRKSRSKYVDPDASLRKVYHGANPRTLVSEWAKKEVRNLKKLNKVGIPSPQPILMSGNIVLMTFVGSDDTGSPAPSLADTNLSSTKLSQLYRDIIKYIRRMYVKCRIVHTDLSEFNILYHDGRAYIIDVSQAVQLGHPNAQVFLRKDCHNVTEYFRKNEVATMPLDDLLDFVTDSKASEDNVDALIQAAQDRAINHPITDRTGEDVVDKLANEDDIDDKKEEEEKDGEEEEERCSEEDRGGSPAKKVKGKRPKNETTEERKVRKRALKQARREKLKTADTCSKRKPNLVRENGSGRVYALSMPLSVY